MGRGVAKRFVGLPYNLQKVHGRNSIFPNVQSRSHHTGRGELMQCTSYRIQPSPNDESMVKQLALLEEYQESVTIQLAKYQQQLAWQYNRDVKTRKFEAGDLVLQKVVGNMQDTNAGKLAPTQEGPYRVIVIAGIGAYDLEDLDKRPLPWLWNICNLKKFYH